jgi:hypothetical protein
VDLWGLWVGNQSTSLLQNSSTAPLGTGKGKYTITDAGCVLTAYVRLANALGKKEWTLEEANKIAVDNGLFINEDELSIDNGVKLVNMLIDNPNIKNDIRKNSIVRVDVFSVANTEDNTN